MTPEQLVVVTRIPLPTSDVKKESRISPSQPFEGVLSQVASHRAEGYGGKLTVHLLVGLPRGLTLLHHILLCQDISEHDRVVRSSPARSTGTPKQPGGHLRSRKKYLKYE